MSVQFRFDNSYARLPPRFFAPVLPTAVPGPRLVRVNRGLAVELGLDPDWLASPEGVSVLAGNAAPDGAEPIATAYAGHQFGSFVPQLGDGRAILLGEVVDRAGSRRDVQLKGSGPTPFSRSGDGRAALGPVLREYLVSEAMAALGIPTTRALAAVATGEAVLREQALPGAVLTRVASSHIRVGSFQFFAARRDVAGLKALADHVVARHYPEAAESARPYRALLDGVIARQAELVARWLLVGFVHGVMNTDNMSVAGETIDYGPCAFLDAYDPTTVFSSIDQGGRYAYANQPGIARWNLTRLAETLLPLLAESDDAAVADATEALDAFAPRFERAYHGGLGRKLGLLDEQPHDALLANALLRTMAENRADFTATFRALNAAAVGSGGAAPMGADPTGTASPRRFFADPSAFDAWETGWRERLALDPPDEARRAAVMRTANPVYIPRNHRIEAAISAALNGFDLQPFERLLAVLARPFDERAEAAGYEVGPEPGGPAYRTFCGT